MMSRSRLCTYLIFLTAVLHWQARGSTVKPVFSYSVKWIPPSDVQRTLLYPAGVDNEKPYFIGRTDFHGGQIPGKVYNDENLIWFGFNGQEYNKDKFEMLVYPRGTLVWIGVVGGDTNGTHIFPENAFQGGTDPETGEAFYICRAWHDRKLIVGKVSPRSKVCGVALHGKDHEYEDFDVLIWNQPGGDKGRLNAENCSKTFLIVTIWILALFIIASAVYNFRMWTLWSGFLDWFRRHFGQNSGIAHYEHHTTNHL